MGPDQSKEMIMTLNPRRVRPALLLGVMLPLAGFAAGPGAGPSTAAVPSAGAIEGVWDSKVTLVSCQDPTVQIASFRALNQFDHHGALVATSQVAPPPSLGKWKWLGGRKYRATFRFQRFGAGGTFEGLTQVTREIQLASNGKSFAGVVATELYDLSDTLFATGCGVEEARRVF
jgi:hypothetical protein